MDYDEFEFEKERKEWAKVGLEYYQYVVNLELGGYPETIEPPYFRKVNGATINPAKRNAFIELDHLKDNRFYNGCFCTLNDGDKLGDFFDRLPYGVINKNITGIGATSLELKADRNSIIVLPIKALAYNKYKTKTLHDGDGSCMYVGSPIGDIKSDITPKKIEEYLRLENGKPKKFLVVADSLPKVLRTIGEKHYNDYFLMIDEIDSLQSDSTYRPALENVMDYYTKFDYTNRAAVSATLRDFTHPVLLEENVITTAYKNMPKRRITLSHTNNEDMATIITIQAILKKDRNSKILVAYNSLDGMLVCIDLLLKELGKDIDSNIGILCGEMSKDKAGRYYTHIEEDGTLSKQIIFMTCAYFVGVDINESRHVISVSTFNQPFTLLSIEKMAQIAGRCRPGTLSETIIYETKREQPKETSIKAYRSKLLKKAEVLSNAIKHFKEALDEYPELIDASNYMENIIKYVSSEKIENDYPVPLLRLNKDKEIVPAYFNIDALLERWELYYKLFSSTKLLYDRLKKQGHIITKHPIYHEFTAEQRKSLTLVKGNKAEEGDRQLQEAKQNLSVWDTLPFNKQKNDVLDDYIKKSKKRVKRYYEDFKKFSPYYRTEYLADLLLEYATVEKRVYKRFINSLVLWTLADNHPFKTLFLREFMYHSIIGTTGRQTGINITAEEKRDKMNKICKNYFVGYPIDENQAASLLSCMFKHAPTKKCFRIIGLNPLDLKEPVKRISDEVKQQELLDMLILK